MFQWIKWAAPVTAMGMLLGFSALSLKAEDAPAPAPAKGIITGVVSTPDGKPAVGAVVRLLPHNAEKKHKKHEPKVTTGDSAVQLKEKAAHEQHEQIVPDVKTDADGKFIMKDVPVGTYDVGAHLKGVGKGKSNDVNVEDGKTASVTITLEPKKDQPKDK